MAVFAAAAGERLYLLFPTPCIFYYEEFLVKKGLGDYRAVTLVSKTEGVRSSALPRSVGAVELSPKLRL